LFLGRATAEEKKQHEVKIVLGDKGMISDRPITISVQEALTPQLRSQIAQAIKHYPEATVRLTLGGVTPPSERKSIQGFKVFLNKPDATAATPVDDPHYARSIEFAPTNDAPQAFAFDILRTLVALKKFEQFDILDPEKPFKVTIVPNPAPGVSRLPDEASFSVHTLALEVPEPKKH
jgi:hypothetical protein